MMIDWLESEEDEYHKGDRIFDLDGIKAKFEVRDICEGGYLVLNPKEHWLRFAVLQWIRSECDGSNAKLQMVFYGEGPGASNKSKEFSLRECRHTYWGERENYMFYVRPRIIVAGLKALEEFFDFDN